MSKQTTTTFTSLNGDVLACIAAFLDVTGKAKLTMINKCTADALSRPHAWDGTLDFFPMQIHHIDKALAIMPQRTWIKTIKLMGDQFYLYSTYSIKQLVDKCPMLQHLDLNGCDMITDSVLDQLAGMQLQYLDLNGCDMITDYGLQNLADLQLQHLNLWGCKMITDDGLRHLFGMPLRHLSLSGFRITNAGLRNLAGMPLQHLCLNGCDMITDAGLRHLAGMQLQYLDLSDCKITDAGLQHLAGMPLQHLYLYGCRITQDGLKNFPNLARVAKF
jgi:uncharacterized protein YjbI with pentapeptide repeats